MTGREDATRARPAGAEVVTIETPELGDRSYLVHDGQAGVVVDPQRDIDRVLALVEELGVEVSHVLETHLHNDYVTGGLALAEEVNAEYLVPAGDEVEFEIEEGQRGKGPQAKNVNVTKPAPEGYSSNSGRAPRSGGSRW